MKRKKGRLGRFRDKFQLFTSARIYEDCDGQTKYSQGPIGNVQGGGFWRGLSDEVDVKDEVILDFKLWILN